MPLFSKDKRPLYAAPLRSQVLHNTEDDDDDVRNFFSKVHLQDTILQILATQIFPTQFVSMILHFSIVAASLVFYTLSDNQ